MAAQKEAMPLIRGMFSTVCRMAMKKTVVTSAELSLYLSFSCYRVVIFSVHDNRE